MRHRNLDHLATLARIVVLLALSPVNASAAVAPPDPAEARWTVAEVLDRLNIVEAKGTTVLERKDLSDEGGRGAEVTMAVTRVFTGRGVEKGVTFWVIAADGHPGMVS